MTRTEELVDALVKNGFYLGGSRKFRNHPDVIFSAERLEDYLCKQYIEITKESDWDFSFDVKDIGKCETLRELGFVRCEAKSSHYADMTFVSIWKHPECDDIEVIRRTRYREWKTIFNSISPEFFINYLWKSNPHHVILDLERRKVFIKNWFDNAICRELYRMETLMEEYV